MRKTLACLGAGFGSMLLVGGLRVAASSELRPPRLPNRRPPRWVIPAVGAVWTLASYCGYYAYARASHRLTTSLLACLAVPGAAAIVFEGVRLRCAAKNPTVPPHTLVVLGCALKNNQPSDLLAKRLQRAVAACDERTERIICSGGFGSEAVTDATCSEADAMVEWLVANAGDVVKRGDIELIPEDQATNTSENIDYACDLMRGTDSALSAGTVVVTSDFHAPRVAKLVRERRLESWCVVGAYTPLRYWATSMLREFLAQFILWAPRGNARILRISRVQQSVSH